MSFTKSTSFLFELSIYKSVFRVFFVFCLTLSNVFAQDECKRIEEKISGINYDLYTVDLADLSTATLSFNVTADFQGQVINLSSGTCGSGCRKKIIGPGIINSDIDLYEFYIVRFAKSGRVETPEFSFNWLVSMEECDGLAGEMKVETDDSNNPIYPAELSLSGRMIITLQVDGLPLVVRLRSREQPILEGLVPQWPPYNTVINLTNGPIAYYNEDDMDNPDAKPILMVNSNEVVLGDTASLFQSFRPKILSGSPVDSLGLPWVDGEINGIQLNWEKPIPGTECPIDFFHIYRNMSPGELNEWTYLTSVPSTQNTYIDKDYDGTVAIEYLVINATEFNFNFEYEGGIGSPFVAPQVTDVREASPNPFEMRAYPNPFSATTKIEFKLAGPQYLELNIYNSKGQKINSLLREKLPGGEHQVDWVDNNLPPGLYYCELKSTKYVQYKKLIMF